MSNETPMSPGRGPRVTDGKQDLSTLKIQFSMGNCRLRLKLNGKIRIEDDSLNIVRSVGR